MNQTWENSKKPSFRFAPNLGQKIFFVGFTLTRYYALLQAITVCYFKGKLMNKTWENSKIPSFRPNFSHFLSKFSPQIFFSWVSPLLEVRNSCGLSLYAISTKKVNQMWKNSEKTSFRPNFGQNFSSKKFLFQGFYLYLTLYIVGGYHCMLFPGKLINQTSENVKKNLFRDQFWSVLG